MMKKALVLALAAVACAAWFASSELPELGKRDSDAASVRVAGFPSDRAGVSAARPRTFATLPDRGDLVSYPTPSPARVDGAYTWHRAELSEEHAFQSLQTGSLRITSPSGRPLEFEYSRHVEHPSGDWTWIGRLKGGQEADEAVITFGERAAFGSISEPGGLPLRLTTQAGVAWLVETDSRKIADIRNEATQPSGPDYLLPPDRAATLASASAGPSASASVPSSSSAISAAAATTVDVVIGYTNGFAAAQGGQSQAVTRLNNMVEIANQAYANSQVDAAIRMVHALQVNYPDNSANQAALENLTGYRSGAGQIPVDPAFAALRAARDQYGGDLVTLVRKFETPENDGCGIAWLIGGGQSGIDSGDAPFGYSVVSDGTDVGTDGKSYFCRQETLAHELGHNMGSQHDRVTATENGQLEYGVFPYSFGYKPEAGGNFYTVMAYGDTGQTAFRIFSNPRSTFCGGAPCGIADQSDNARSLSQTMPIVSSFRAGVPQAVRKVRNDVDANGRSDFLWYHPGMQRIAYWSMDGNTILRHGGQLSGGDYRVFALGDYSGDGRVDLIWRGPGDDLQMWVSNGTTFDWRPFVMYPGGWSLVGSHDVNGDGTDDLIWFNSVMQRIAFWLLNGNQIIQHGGQDSGGGYRVATVGDYDGNGRADLIWLGPSGDLQMWLGDGTGFTWRPFVSYPAGWELIGSQDVDGDQRSDVIWYHPTRQLIAYWIMNGNGIVRHGEQASGGGYRVLLVGDYDGNARADLVWLGPQGDLQMWFSNGVSFDWRPLTNYPGGWTALGR